LKDGRRIGSSEKPSSRRRITAKLKPPSKLGVKIHTMKKTIALIFAASTLFLASCCTTPQATVWEYKIVQANSHLLLEQGINKAAAEGWQLQCFQPDDSRIPFAVMRRHRE
jgi:hypothetical protein